ncbi:MAG: R3H domain-containing nucleic acid-binding protein [bacterium]
MDKLNFYSDLEKMISVLPRKVGLNLRDKCLDDLTEIVLDYGRPPEIRHSDGKIEYLGEEIVTLEDLESVTKKIESFTSDNRSGIPGTLHRISAIRNRKGHVIGLTCRVGRVVTGTISCIRDLVITGKSILFLGRPGVGKTTKLREIARLIADELGKRVIVIDTSNEIAGDGDVPHAAIGRARRMQVESPEKQKDVMIEAVENHTPEVIVVDEIGTEAEALAARTIAERGVMLVATAHGNVLENLIKNPLLSDLVGGISSVTLGDDEARKRSCQKTILEREKQPTFDMVVEIVDRNTLAVYKNTTEAVDFILRGWPIQPEIRNVDETYTSCSVEVVKKEQVHPSLQPVETREKPKLFNATPQSYDDFDIDKYMKDFQPNKKIYIYAVSRSLIDKLIERLDINAEVTRNIDEADIVISHKSYEKAGAKILNVAKNYQIPIYFVKSNTMGNIQKTIKEALNIKCDAGDMMEESFFNETDEALEEAKTAVNKVLAGVPEIELLPRKQHIRRLQHELVEQHNLTSKSIGDEPNRRLKVLSCGQGLKNVG